MSKGRMQAGSCTAGMRREEVEALIRAANLGEEDSYIARRCLIDQVAQLDIAFEMEDNAARERGTTVEQMAQQLGLPFRR